MTPAPGGWVLLAAVVAAVAAGVVLAAVSSGAAGVTLPSALASAAAARLVPQREVEQSVRCRRTLEYLLDDKVTSVATSWDPQQFEPAAATPCTVYSEAAVVAALGRTLTFANGRASCCASAYFSSVLRPLSWMRAPGRPHGSDLCIPDTYWENLGWHVANFATGMHKDALSEEGSYGLTVCRFPDHLLTALRVEQENWACVYARRAAELGAGSATRFVLPAYTNAVRPKIIPGSEVAADLRQCPANPEADAAASRAGLPDGTARFAWLQAAEDSSSTTVQLLTPTANATGAGTKQSRWEVRRHNDTPQVRAKRLAEAAKRKATLAPSPRRCGRCPIRYTAINDRWCCARYCDWYSNSMALAVTSRLPSQFGCCVKMNKRCITSK